MKIRGNLGACALAAALAAGAITAPAARADTFRVCADPDNLPFSKAEGPERGMYVELAELVGKQLKQPVEYVWWYTQMQRRALRNTILKNECDAVFALPADADYEVRGLQRSHPFLQVSYAIVAAPGFSFKGLEDLKTQRIGVQFSTPPQILLSSLDGYQMTTYHSADEALNALDKKEIDVAFLWGPQAGFENKTHWANRWSVTPVSGHGLSGQMAVAVQRGKDDLIKAIDRALDELRPQTLVLADKYGFPHAVRIELARRPEATRLAAAKVPASYMIKVSDTVPDRLRRAAPARTTDIVLAEAEPELTEPQAGRVEFNSRCSHCHGSDGYSPVRERDVRFLKLRYGDKWQEVAATTIKNGRPDFGMPTWGGALSDLDIHKIISFFGTIQKN